MDGDGDLDAFVANGHAWLEPNNVWLNQGGIQEGELGEFSDSGQHWELALWSLAVALGDLDGDGDLDAFVGNSESQPNKIWLNNSFSLVEAASLSGASTQPLTLGDVDGNGRLDIVNFKVWRNEGRLSFSETAGAGSLSGALGNLDDDNDLDIIGGVVWENGGSNGLIPVTKIPDLCTNNNLALGDLDGDNDLDVVAADSRYGLSAPIKVCQNDGDFDFTEVADLGEWPTNDLALGDLDGDGDLDAVLANGSFTGPTVEQINRVWRNDGDFKFTEVAGLGDSTSRAAALGDLDGDGDLDLLVGNEEFQADKIWRNDGGFRFTEMRRLGNTSNRDVALGDIDGDGDLDLLTVGDQGPSQVWRNDGDFTFTDVARLGDPLREYDRVAVGDLDQNGNLEVVLVSSGGSIEVYRQKSSAETRFQITLSKPDPTHNANFYSSPFIQDQVLIPLSYTLFDPERDSIGWIAASYSLDGGDNWQPAMATPDTLTTSLAATPLGVTHVYTWDTFASGVFGQSDNVVFRIEAYPQPVHSGEPGTYQYPHSAPGPFQWSYASTTTFPFRVQGSQVQVTGTMPISNAIVYRLPVRKTTGAVPLAPGSGQPFRTDNRGYLQGRGRIAISDTLVAMQPISSTFRGNGILVFDGVDDDISLGDPPSLNLSGPMTLEAWVNIENREGRQTIIGRSSNAAELYLGLNNGDYQIGSGSPDELALISAPILVEDVGTWVHLAGVYDGTMWHLYRNGEALGGPMTATLPLSGAWTIGSSNVVGDQAGRFFQGALAEVHLWQTARTPAEIVTDMNSILTGRELGLAASWAFEEGGGPVIQDLTGQGHTGQLRGPVWGGRTQYTVYHTSAVPNETGLAGKTVEQGGVITLTVSPENPLILFDLDVSLEWDARNDRQFLNQLQFDLLRTSELIYDWSNGQAALGQINVYHDQEQWLAADVQIYASNKLRPNAVQGGMVSEVITDVTDVSTVTYGPGQIRMGSSWNRYGESGDNLGEDWPRALAHELGHYLFYLDDHYLGLKDEILVPVDTCPNSAMTDPYRDDHSEFLPQLDEGCQDTLAAKTTGRSDWETVRTFYPWLHEGPTDNPGPEQLTPGGDENQSY